MQWTHIEHIQIICLNRQYIIDIFLEYQRIRKTYVCGLLAWNNILLYGEHFIEFRIVIEYNHVKMIHVIKLESNNEYINYASYI